MKRGLPFHSNAVWPAAWMVVLFVALYGMMAGGMWLIHIPLRKAGETAEQPETIIMRMTVLVMAAGAYAAFRLFRFHPACNHGYAGWLKLSPWTPDKPLPLGPVCLVWQDLVVLGTLTATAFWLAHGDPMLPVAIFGLVYFGGLTLLLAYTRRWWCCFVLGFLWPALTLPAAQGTPAIIIAATIIIVIWHGHLQSLQAFPWKFVKHAARPASILQIEIQIDGPGGGGQSKLGWPLFALSPKIQISSVSPLTSACLGALASWWCFCAMIDSKAPSAPELILMFAIGTGFFRFVFYGSRISPPFNVWGRIASGRILVPGFDKVFLTPLAALLVAILGGMIIKRSGPWYPETESVVFGLIWYVQFGGGPTLRNWMLTGQHRLRPPARANASKQQLREV